MPWKFLYALREVGEYLQQNLRKGHANEKINTFILRQENDPDRDIAVHSKNDTPKRQRFFE